MFVYTPHQSRQSLYKDLSIPLTSPLLSNSTSQNFQPLTTIHPNHNPLKSNGIFPAITYPIQPKIETQSQSQNKPSLNKYLLPQPSNPIVGASSKPPDMNMLTIDPDPPKPISSFLKAITLEDSNNPLVLPIIADTDLDLSDLGLEGRFMYQQDDQPTVEEGDVFHPSPPPPIFPPPSFVPDNQTHFTYSLVTNLKHLFTIDDAPPSKWHEKFFDIYSWCTIELHVPNSTVAQVIAKFIARLTRRIREWWISLGKFRQRHAAKSQTLEDFFTSNLLGTFSLSTKDHFAL